MTKGDTIRVLEARLAALEHPDDAVAISQEPLVSRSLSRMHFYLSLLFSSRETAALRTSTALLLGLRPQLRPTQRSTYLLVGSEFP